MGDIDLERERGITIMVKNTAIRYKNYLDTSGYADFGEEVKTATQKLGSRKGRVIKRINHGSGRIWIQVRV
ncbi:MAG: hypothetical protein JHC31_01090 [Sulfurihydrogenibium sp.]|jgi:translation elongation factor EF-G|nr:hypothetical protein [Sulfurihydrogenibium sp.]